MTAIKKLFVLLVLSGTFLFSQGFDEQQVDISVKSPKNVIKAGETAELIIIADIADHWHINSHKPKDEFLIPTTIEVISKEFTLKGIKFPEPLDMKLAFSDKPVSVFEGSIKIVVTLIAKKDIQGGNSNIKIKFNYQSCNNSSCMPPNTIESDVVLKTEKSLSSDINPSLSGNVPEASISQSTDSIKNLEPVKETQKEVIAEKNTEENEEGLASRSLLLNILFVFLGGLALNLTPCVYPLIPITIGYFGGQSEGSTGKLFGLGVFYVLGMALTYSVVGVVTSLSGAVFGSLLQNPFVIIGISLVFVALALSMFGLYEFKMPDSWVMKAGGAKTGVFGAFFMGLTMGVVAAPCIGPFVLSLVTFVAAKGDPFYGFIMFFSLAVGLGTPYLILAVFSGKLKSLPRAGFWMTAVKHIFGFIMLGMAIYFVNPILPKEISEYTLPVFMFFAALYLLIFDKLANNIEGFRIFKIVFSLIIYTFAVISLSNSIFNKNETSEEINWQKLEVTSYEEALNNNKIMVIDFYADWCIPCKEFDEITFRDKEVIELSKKFTTFKADMTKSDDKNNELRRKFKVHGFPTIIFIDSKGNEVERLVGFVDAGEFSKILKRIN